MIMVIVIYDSIHCIRLRGEKGPMHVQLYLQTIGSTIVFRELQLCFRSYDCVLNLRTVICIPQTVLTSIEESQCPLK